MEYYSAIIKNEILPFATIGMDLGNIMLREISQPENVKHHMILLMWDIKLLVLFRFHETLRRILLKKDVSGFF